MVSLISFTIRILCRFVFLMFGHFNIKRKTKTEQWLLLQQETHYDYYVR